MSEVKLRKDEQPQWMTHEGGDGYWTVPHGFKHPSCQCCGHKWWNLKPQRSIGGASVRGPLCAACQRDIERMERGYQ